MSKNKKDSADTRDITVVIRTDTSKDIETSIPYIKQAADDHTLTATVANSGFTIVLPPMRPSLGTLFFAIGGRAAYIKKVNRHQKPNEVTLDEVTRDRIIETFRVGDLVTIWPYIMGDEGMVRGSPSEEITII